MSPDRATRGYSSVSSSSKPYSRNGSALSGLSLSSASSYGGLLPVLDSSNGGQAPGMQLDGVLSTSVSTSGPVAQNNERPGFPSYAQYKQIETGYIESLTPRRQGKALISQSMFDRIWDVLHHPESQLETAQFRFWARKMFTINKNYRITLGVSEGQESPAQEVLLHDNLLVAIQEQLYDLLCYCHGSTGHGGRDKTCALIRKHYTWVPKDLVSNFIKACPTCIMKKCGNMDVNSQIPHLMVEADKLTGAARLISPHPATGRSPHQQVQAHRQQQQSYRATPHDENGLNLNHSHSRTRHRHQGAGGAVSTRSSKRRVVMGGDMAHLDPIVSSLGFDAMDQAQSGGSFYTKMSASGLGSSSMSALQESTNQLVSDSHPWSTFIGSPGHSLHHSSHLTGRHSGLTATSLMSDEHDLNAMSSTVDDHHSMSTVHSHHASPDLSGNNIPFNYAPMVREVSLYKGLPNGWQYRHDDFESAHAEFMDHKAQWDSPSSESNNFHTHHARIPDLAGFWGPEHFRSMVKEESEEEELDMDSALGMNMGHARGDGNDQGIPRDHQNYGHHRQDMLQYPIPPPMIRHMDLSDSCLPPSLRNFQPHLSMENSALDMVDSQGAYMPEIDPALLALASGAPMDMEVQPLTMQMVRQLTKKYSSISAGNQGETCEPTDDAEDPGMLSTSSTLTSLARRVRVPPPLDFSILDQKTGDNDAATTPRSSASGSSDNSEASSNIDSSGAAQLLSPYMGLKSDGDSTDGTPVTTPVRDENEKKLGGKEGENVVNGARDAEGKASCGVEGADEQTGLAADSVTQAQAVAAC